MLLAFVLPILEFFFVVDTVIASSVERAFTVSKPLSASDTGAAADNEVVQDATDTSPPARTPEAQTPTGKFMTATEVRPIIDATKANWVAVRNDDGQDLLYFTSLLTWRCGLWDIQYGINGAQAEQMVQMEPCHVDTAQPNAMLDPVAYPLWVSFPPETVQSVTVRITYDDGTTDQAVFDRAQILIN